MAGHGVTGASRPRRGQRVEFSPPAAQDRPAPPVAPLLNGRAVLDLADGTREVDLSAVEPRDVAARLVWALALKARPGAGIKSRQYAARFEGVIRGFCAHLRDTGRGDAAFADLLPDDIDGFEDRERERLPEGSTTPWMTMYHLTTLLALAASEFGPGSIGERVLYVANGDAGVMVPRDGYDGAAAEAIRRACKRDIAKALRRITADGAALLARGNDPSAHGWDVPNTLWLIANAGRVEGNWWRDNDHFVANGPITEIYRYLYPTVDDLLPFNALLQLTTGLPPESANALKADCLVNQHGGNVEIAYYKARRHGQQDNTLRVRDGNLQTGGGIVRAALAVTALAREHAGTNDLWTHYANGRLRRTAGSSFARAAHAFAARHALQDSNGDPLVVVMPRLRKTYKAERYRAANGMLDPVANDHSKRIAARHYLATEALREVHEGAVEDGIGEALAEATPGPVVVPGPAPDDPPAAPAAPAAPVQVTIALGPPAATDVWLASCSDFHDSPFGRPGEPCPVPPWGCLECGNAVITSRKLPAVLAFLDFATAQRELVNASDWASRYGKPYARIVDQVLPKFSEDELIEAAALSRTDPLATYMPLLAGAPAQRPEAR